MPARVGNNCQRRTSEEAVRALSRQDAAVDGLATLRYVAREVLELLDVEGTPPHLTNQRHRVGVRHPGIDERDAHHERSTAEARHAVDRERGIRRERPGVLRG